ncbi:MAG: type III pantothenate kinase [Bacteroidales bacterium]|nr:type III pantothenate kinase [Bacteroidales bacterium]
MEYYLTIDRGNSKLKAALWDKTGHLVSQSSSAPERLASEVALDLMTPVFDSETVLAGCAYSSVVATYTERDLSGLQTLCHRVLNVTSAVKLPFRNDYPTLGADRIAAICGALEIAPKGRPLLVVDSGTAVTYEFIDSEGNYLGGNIAPGLRLRINSLFTQTDALPEIPTGGPVPLIGYDTDTAIRSGVVLGMLGEILYYIKQWGPDVVTVLTGGGSSYMEEQSLLTFEHILDAHLVLRGLYTILRYNEIN